MMSLAAVALTFLICVPPSEPDGSEYCEDGRVVARACDLAERWMRDGLRPGQVLHVLRCEEDGAPAASRVGVVAHGGETSLVLR